MSNGPIYAYSRVTDQWYRVHEWVELSPGQIRAESKEPVGREEVPQEYMDGVDERPREGENAA